MLIVEKILIKTMKNFEDVIMTKAQIFLMEASLVKVIKKLTVLLKKTLKTLKEIKKLWKINIF